MHSINHVANWQMYESIDAAWWGQTSWGPRCLHTALVSHSDTRSGGPDPNQGRRPSDITRLYLVIKTPTHTRIRWSIITILLLSFLFIRIISILEKTAMVNAHPCSWFKATYLTSKRYKQSWKYSPELSRLEILTDWPHGTLQKWAKLFSCLAMISGCAIFHPNDPPRRLDQQSCLSSVSQCVIPLQLGQHSLLLPRLVIYVLFVELSTKFREIITIFRESPY